MRKLLLALSIVSLPLSAAEIGTQTTYGEELAPQVTSASELTAERAQATYMTLSTIASDPQLAKNGADKAINAFKAVRDATEQTITTHRAGMCAELFKLDLTDIELAVNYWFEENEKFDQFQADTQAQALEGLPAELLNVVSGYSGSNTVTITPESILAGNPQQWIDDQKYVCENQTIAGGE